MEYSKILNQIKKVKKLYRMNSDNKNLRGEIYNLELKLKQVKRQLKIKR